VVADEPHSFAESCFALLKDPLLRLYLVAQGRKLMEEKYNWESIEGLVRTVAGGLLEGRRE